MRVALDKLMTTGPQRARNEQRRRTAEQDTECYLCARPLASTEALWLHVCDGGDVGLPPTERCHESAADGCLGLCPVGPECVKKLPAALCAAIRAYRRNEEATT